MNCQKCSSNRVLNVTAKSKDLCTVSMWNQDHDGYVPDNMGIGGGDYIEIELCLQCGYVNGEWPLAESKLERKFKRKLEQKSPQVKTNTTPPPQRNPAYAEYLDTVVKTALSNPHGGINAVTAVMFVTDDPDMLVAAIVELFSYEELRNMVETIVELFKPYYPEPGWEHWDKLKLAIAPFMEKDDEDEDEDEDD